MNSKKLRELRVLRGENEFCMKKAFTITELMVAVSVMAVVLVGTGYIFKIAIQAQRTAGATAEIMRNLRGITDQLDSDFRGLRKDAPVAIRFGTNVPTNDLRADRIRFFASGDFQSLRQYEYTKSNGAKDYKTVAGNVACICYGQSTKPDPFLGETRKKILTRNQTIFTSDMTLRDPCTTPITQEYRQQSLAEWKASTPTIDVNTWTRPPTINDPNHPAEDEIPVYMAKGVDNFTVQISSGIDPNGSGSLIWWPDNAQVATPLSFNSYPKAIKFTFTLYDSKGIIKNGLKFTHIVYLEQ